MREILRVMSKSIRAKKQMKKLLAKGKHVLTANVCEYSEMRIFKRGPSCTGYITYSFVISLIVVTKFGNGWRSL